MIVTELIGGLGNQLFQYAAGMALAQHHQVDLKLDSSGFARYPLRKYALKPFRTTASELNSSELNAFRPGTSIVLRGLRKLGLEAGFTGRATLHREKREFSFDPNFLSLPARTYLTGYWQSWKYADLVERRLRDEFTLVGTLGSRSAELLGRLNEDEFVAVHVRRGDYVNHPKTQSVHGNCGLDYYESASRRVQTHRPSAKFLVFSDDLDWCREHLRLPGSPVFYADTAGSDCPEEDLILMAACRHHIIANSSFSWWGAWLGKNPDQIVIAPKRWLADSTIDTSALTPPGWERI